MPKVEVDYKEELSEQEKFQMEIAQLTPEQRQELLETGEVQEEKEPEAEEETLEQTEQPTEESATEEETKEVETDSEGEQDYKALYEKTEKRRQDQDSHMTSLEIQIKMQEQEADRLKRDMEAMKSQLQQQQVQTTENKAEKFKEKSYDDEYGAVRDVVADYLGEQEVLKAQQAQASKAFKEGMDKVFTQKDADGKETVAVDFVRDREEIRDMLKETTFYDDNTIESFLAEPYNPGYNDEQRNASQRILLEMGKKLIDRRKTTSTPKPADTTQLIKKVADESRRATTSIKGEAGSSVPMADDGLPSNLTQDDIKRNWKKWDKATKEKVKKKFLGR